MSYRELAPSEWGAQVDYDLWNDRAYEKDKVYVHYNGPALSAAAVAGDEQAELAALRAAEQFHLYTRGWRGLAYGWAIGNTGTVYRARGWNRYGAHLGDYDMDGILENDEGIPVFFILGEGQSPSPAALEAFAELHARLEQDNRSDGDLEVLGHRDTQSTSCPGEILYQWLQDFQGDDYMTPFYTELEQLVVDSGGNPRSLFYTLELLRALAGELDLSATNPQAIATALVKEVAGPRGPRGYKGDDGTDGADGADGELVIRGSVIL